MFARPAHARKSRSLSLESQTVWRVAERLFRFQTEGKWDTFYNVLPAYAEPLGKNGLRRYRELVNEAWEALPALALGKEYRRSYDSPRMQLEHAMEALAELDGDVDALIRIRSKDLSSPYQLSAGGGALCEAWSPGRRAHVGRTRHQRVR